jgi:hypothetical protein
MKAPAYEERGVITALIKSARRKQPSTKDGTRAAVESARMSRRSLKSEVVVDELRGSDAGGEALIDRRGALVAVAQAGGGDSEA